ncbi:MAG: winged helix-turn-helix transcriptional regulator [Tissierellia bacterium]|nr:winged helix-turn-helix transcriptional regulator [Tissierellia bacterium]
MEEKRLPLSENIEHRKIIESKAQLLKALSNPIRLCLMEQLVENGEMNVSEIMDCMGTTQSGLSQHLAKLRDMGLVESRKSGNQVFYTCENEELCDLIKYILVETESL